jgi:hypothetical protein
MTEVKRPNLATDREACELLRQARILAETKGLDPCAVMCVIQAICDGRFCGLIVRSEQTAERQYEKRMAAKAH